MGKKEEEQKEERWYFCESVGASSFPQWHIRPRGPKGRMEGGGADTESLCGRKMAWDLKVEVTPKFIEQISGICLPCRGAWRQAQVDV